MEIKVSFFEIPAADFDRAVGFYENLFGVKLGIADGGHEKMACFPGDPSPGAVSWSSAFEFVPSPQGVLVSFHCADPQTASERITAGGGKILIPWTQIENEGHGQFCVFLDSEGNRAGLYTDN